MPQTPRKPVVTLDKAQLECLGSPLRSEILSLLISEGPMSVTDLGRSTGYRKNSLYYPLRKLIACELVRPAAVSLKGKRPEQLFDAAMDRLELPKADPATDVLANQTLIRALSVSLREAIRATESPQGLGLDIVCHRNVVRLSDADRKELLRMLSDVSEFVRERTNVEAPPYSLTMALVPRVSSGHSRTAPPNEAASP